jgi:type IV secretion system protein VirD4
VVIAISNKIKYIIPLLFGLYILDAWLVSTLAAFTVDKSLVNYYFLHPMQTSTEYFLSLFGKEVYNIEVFKYWKMLNVGFILIAAAVFMYKSTGDLQNKSGLLGSADWLTLNEAKQIFNTKLSPGILFGTSSNQPIVLPPEARGNRNVAVLGPPGTGKSRAYVRNNLFQAVTSKWSVVVTDPKGELARDFRKFFKGENYIVKVFNLVDMANSDRWNPLSEIRTDIDAQMFCEVVIANTAVPGKKGGDPFWDRAETNLLKGLVLYVINELPTEERNLGEVYKILASGDPKHLDNLFSTLPYDHPAKMPYNIYAETSPQVRSGVIIGLGTRLQVFQNEMVRKLTETSDISLSMPGRAKSAYFCIVSDMDHTFDFLASLYFSFLFINLTRTADRNGGELDIPVNFLLDEFCNIGHIPDFTKKISTMRGRGIAVSVIFQSLVQLKSHYPDSAWETIMADCNSWLILGVQDVTSAKYISDHMGISTITTKSHRKSLGKPLKLGDETTQYKERRLMNPDELIRLATNEAILSAFGLKPFKIEKMDYTKHPMAKLLDPEPINNFRPAWSFPGQTESTDSANNIGITENDAPNIQDGIAQDESEGISYDVGPVREGISAEPFPEDELKATKKKDQFWS